MPHKSKKTKRRRKKAARGRKAQRWKERLASIPPSPPRRRRLLGIGSSGVSLDFRNTKWVEVPYDPENPVESAERNLELVVEWEAKGHPTKGEA